MANPLHRLRKAVGLTVPDPGQVGAAATPAAHTADAPVRGYDPAEDEIAVDRRTMADVVPAEVRRWRAPARAIAPAAAGPAAADGVGGAMPMAHADPGRPDPRHVWDSGPIGAAGYPLPKTEGLYPSPETLINVRPDVVIAPSPAPVRVRAGSTGDDATRPATVPLWLFFRPFDKWSSEANGITGVTKIEEASPTASLPIHDTADVIEPIPSAGGWRAASGMAGAGASPNTTRLIPRSWDELLITTAQTGTPEAARRAGGWRARG